MVRVFVKDLDGSFFFSFSLLFLFLFSLSFVSFPASVCFFLSLRRGGGVNGHGDSGNKGWLCDTG